MALEWSYIGPNGLDTWSKHFPNCTGERQSPIDINQTHVTHSCIDNELICRYPPKSMAKITNSGNGWTVRAKSDGSELSGGPLEGKYVLEQFHCHWGENDDEGSEHTINGAKYAAELHIVHRRDKYDSFQQAIQHCNSLVVLGIFIKLGKKHDELEKVVTELTRVEFKGEIVDMSVPLNPGKLLPNNKSCYYSYQGSLTTPPCTECVTWIVFKEPIEVSHDQLAAFRSLKRYAKNEESPCDLSVGCVTHNFRPTVPIGKRKVKEYIYCDK